MKTYTITKDSEFIVDKGHYYLLNRSEWDGNLVIKLDKYCVVEGNQIVKGNQIVEGDQIVKGDQRVKGDQIVEGDQIVKGDQRVEGDQIVEGYQRVEGNQIVEGDQIVKGDQRVKGYQRVEGYQIVEGNQIVEGYQIVESFYKFFNCKWGFRIWKDACKIGSEKKAWEEWDEWFAGDEEFETKRGTKEFALIENAYKCAKEFKNIFNILKD